MVNFLEPKAHKDLLLISDVRNVFVHTLHSITFDNDQIKLEHGNLRSQPNDLALPPPENSSRFLYTVLSICIDLGRATRDHLQRQTYANVLQNWASSSANRFLRAPSPDTEP